MNETYLSWHKYTAGKNLPKLMTIQDILKRQVDMEAEVLVELPAMPEPPKVLPKVKVYWPGLWALANKILP